MYLTRRHMLVGAGLGLGTAVLAGKGVRSLMASEPLHREPGLVEYQMVAQEFPQSLVPGGMTPVRGFNGVAPGPTLRVKQGERLRVTLINRLQEPTTIHWHGIRLPNAMDGVPGLTQPDVLPGESFTYEFVCPDAGSYWYHPHFNSVTQLGMGLSGALIVDEADPPAFDADLELVAKDWRVNEDGSFKPMMTLKGAARGGTFGKLRTVNGAVNPHYGLPAGGLVRLRLINVDITRIYKVMLEGAEAQIIALDGNPLTEPLPLHRQWVGPGQRMDLAVRMPEKAGAEVKLVNTSTSKPWVMSTLVSKAHTEKVAAGLPRLAENPIDRPDLSRAPVIRYDFSAGVGEKMDDGTPLLWAINKKAWPDLGGCLAEPLTKLKRNNSYILEFANLTPRAHPIHLHGMAVFPIKSDKRSVLPLPTDTVMLASEEMVTVGLLADNPGDWMLHCHILEHQDTGMMGVVRVS
ncbi:multicopper oxidase family protein [Rhodovibrionaceae bacterium A322]